MARSARTQTSAILNGGELAVLYCFVLLYLSAAGSGKIGLDRIWQKESD
jgi:uncharacterized membrane protein YphA (DoxX/SURF4 family)